MVKGSLRNIAPENPVRPSIPALVFPRPDLSKPLTLAAAQPVIPKKELRVVHINELDTAGDTGTPGRSNTGVSWAAIPYVQRPVRNVPIFTGKAGKHFFHFGRPKAQVEPSATAATDNIPPEFIKIKLSPQN